MEMHLANFDAVHLCLGLAQPRENSLRQIFGARREPAAINHFGDVMQMAMLVLRLMLNLDLQPAKTLPSRFARHDFHAGQPQRINAGLDNGQIRTGVNQRRQRHIAGNPAGAIKIGGGHEELLGV